MTQGCEQSKFLLRIFSLDLPPWGWRHEKDPLRAIVNCVMVNCMYFGSFFIFSFCMPWSCFRQGSSWFKMIFGMDSVPWTEPSLSRLANWISKEKKENYKSLAKCVWEILKSTVTDVVKYQKGHCKLKNNCYNIERKLLYLQIMVITGYLRLEGLPTINPLTEWVGQELQT